ncbi:MAG TPA: S41 family peptidase, partial [Mycobacteriales bacterium]|nr:S41 family peptidase [Mycobacteriales bacterium]
LLFAGAATPPPEEIDTTMPGVFRARTVTTPSGRYGHLRIFTFYVEDPYAFVAEFVRLAGLLPPDGLIVDVRGNSGGHLFAAEFTLQTLTPRPIVPEPMQFAATPLNLRICRKPTEDLSDDLSLGPWVSSLEQATQLGAGFSSAFPMTPAAGANAWGQRYHGPVVLVTDALCYSATDVFAAGFQDHGIGPVLGVDANTGAGGANVWTHELLRLLLDSAPADPDNPYRPLPKGAEIRVAMRRNLRVGPRAGILLEDLGVVPDVRHHLTRADVLAGNVDLLARAGALLARMPVRALAVRPVRRGTELTLDVSASGVDQVDVYLDGRPRGSVRVVDGVAAATISGAGRARVARVEGFADGELVAARTIRLQRAAGQPAGPTGTSTRST